ncbi:hypothetical protein TVAG_476480 [Trichomonas vaginalis G3]|uniref:receptor protein-tyrosine kinase n=1 Tax=Trichomonas vaginalis (strain ATCC PRA-98 / G3) TaxID=412133 RepID=A2DA71_TRIV3|nr:serine-type endopeptidase protein [Trichomonas vaginalis G3]EAY22719.1 hypothetical protein TVAG_476480 [Trichomonas vaginalis G3]KAI5525531.1 serine-type endopeptidase protein [Trichomonas vaginalis G3]|eukprot:XP_001583705.1 hypothetical protein [Trichomonas vaginalis G3]
MQNYENGRVTILSEYVCIDNCINCENNLTCLECDSNHVLYEGKCEHINDDRLIYNAAGYNTYSSELRPGLYDIECFGAQGGDYWIGPLSTYQGGPGSYAHAKIKVTNRSLPYVVEVGEKGNDNLYNPDGCRPDGGFPILTSEGYKASGGGGSSRVVLDERLYIVAAGGSGGFIDSGGAFGGGNNTCFYRNTTNYDVYETSDTIYMSNDRFGGNGTSKLIGSNIKYGSGGGGGYRGGKGSWEDGNPFSVGVSGTSFISYDESIIFSEIKNGQKVSHLGNGKVTIRSEYICIDNCSNCENSETCLECDSSHVLYEDKCEFRTCPNGHIVRNKECIPCSDGLLVQNDQCVKECDEGYFLDLTNRRCNQCSENCKKCENENTCSKCDSNSFLKDHKCVESCGDGYYQNNDTNNCTACSVTNCLSCPTNEGTCDICSEEFVLYNNSCSSNQCPNSYFSDSNKVCQSCGHNCNKCSSRSKCDECISIDMFADSKGNCTYYRTPSYDSLLNLQPLSREIRRRKKS